MRHAVVMALAVLAGGCFVAPGDTSCEADDDCFAAEECVDGTCMPRVECASPKRLCGRACTDVDSDREHCGACGTRCDDGDVCAAGECGTPEALTAGLNHACVLLAGGDVWCWGSNAEHQLDADRGAGPHLVPVSRADGVTGVSAGGLHTCVVKGATVQCVGGNARGQSSPQGWGGGATRKRLSEVQLPGDVESVSCGFDHSCARLADGAVHCWGDNPTGEFGEDEPAPPTAVSGWEAVDAVGAGVNQTCVVRAGAVECRGATGGVGEPASQARRLAVGDGFVCAYGSTKPTCWPSETAPQLPDELSADATLQAGASDAVVCAVDGGTLSCHGSVPDRTGEAGELSGVRAAAVGDGFACAAADGGISCWGENPVFGVSREDGLVPITW